MQAVRYAVVAVMATENDTAPYPPVHQHILNSAPDSKSTNIQYPFHPFSY